MGSGPPGTPNPQQAMRPTPSPTGSSGSRSMSPAVGQQSLPMPPRPSSSQPQSGVNQLPPTTVGVISNNSNLVNTQQQPHHHHHHQTQQHIPQSHQQQQQGAPQQQPLDSVSVSGSRSQTTGGPPINTQPPSGSLPGTIPPHQQQQPGQTGNNMAAQGNYPPRPQYPSNYGPTPPTGQAPPTNNMPPGPGQYPGRPLPNHVGAPHTQFPPYPQSWAPPSPQAPNMMGNHVQGKGTPPPSQPSVGSPRPLNYLKQHLQHKGGYVGAQSPTPQQGYVNGPGMHPPMGPPHHMGPPLGPTNMGPPTSAPQSTPPPTTLVGVNSHSDGNSTPDPSMSQDNGVSSSGSSTTSSHPVTSVITTGPDGTPLDEASQQSTLSNASAASGEDPQCVTPKSRKGDYNQSHLAPPSASPGAHHGEDFEMSSPSSWSRTAASPVFNSHVAPETYRTTSKKSDSLCKLYDMDDNPERRGWLDKLLSFMEERRTPITACPTISKQPLDLYRLYVLVKERGGFVEVTKSKTWKDIAGLLGIGASSSAAYTLRKHYTKNLLAFECHFDRGGVDPLPIIQQVEAGSKKKTAKAASVPSPVGSSNSQDSFPPPGSTGTSMDGYPGYPSNYPPSTQQDYNTPPQMQRPPSQNNAQAPHTGAPYQGQPGYNQYGTTEQYGPSGPPGQYPPAQNQFPPPNRTMYPPYGPEGDSSTPPTSSTYAPYVPPPRPYNQPPTGASQPPAPTSAAQNPPGTPGTYPPPPPQQDYYRQPEQSAQPRRHPDFAKDSQPYPPYAQRPQIYGGWQNNSGQYRGQYPAQPGPQQWNSGQRPTVPPSPGQQAAQWDQHRYPPQGQQPYQANQQQWSSMSGPTPPSQSSPLRPPQRSSGKPFSMPPPQGAKTVQQPQPAFPTAGQPQKRDIVFPSDSVESTTPVLYRRKRLTKSDVCPIDPWRVFMSLRSGLLAESTWALDILNILLFDDTAVHYFGLAHLPGLLNLLLDHFQKNLSDMFDPDDLDKHGYGWNCLSSQDDENEVPDVDLGQVTNTPNPEERVLILTSTPNFTMISRKGVPVRMQNAEDDIFVSELPKKWDHDSNKNYQLSAPVGSDPWTFGHTEPHPHDSIIDVFKAEIVDIPFPRFLKSDKKDKMETELEGDEAAEVDDADCDVKKVRSYRNKRRLCSKNGLTESKKRTKLKEMPWETSKLDIKEELKELDEKLSKKEHIDSDCREVDMEIEPKVLNGPQQLDAEEIDDKAQQQKQILKSEISKKEVKIEEPDEEEEEEETELKFDPKETVRDPAAILKRRRMSDYEDECYTRDEASLYLVNESHDTMARRCICISNIFRNLTFVPGNEVVLAKSPTFLAILGKLLLLNHEHLVRTQKTRNYDREEDTDFADSCSSLQGESEWWWDYLIQIRENMLVAVANIAGHLELSRYEEIITRPVLDGLLHWAVCPSAHGQDPFPSCGASSSLSPQRLALEALCKLCVTDANVDLVIATPPFSRLEKLCSVLTRHLCRNEDQMLREFSVNLLHYLAAADSAMSRTVALQSPCISYLVAFIEQAEQTALGVANQHGINYLRENPDSMGTSLDMLRRAAGTLLHLSKHPDNRPLFMQQEQRLLGLVMSHILDQQVALIISRVLFQVSRGGGSVTSAEYKAQQRRQQRKTMEQNQSISSILHSNGGNSNLTTTATATTIPSAASAATSVTTTANTVPETTSVTTTTSTVTPSTAPAETASVPMTLTSGLNLDNSNINSNSNSSSNYGGDIATQTNINCSNSSSSNSSSSCSSNSSNSGSTSNSGNSGNNNSKNNNISTTATTNSSNSNSTTPTTAAVA